MNTVIRRLALAWALVGLTAGSAFASTPGGQDAAPMSGEAALRLLMEGNKRYASERCEHPNHQAGRRLAVAKGQHPFAIVLTCADSRVAPEILFDQGMGDLFVHRVAGNIVDDAILGSIEYGAEHLHAPLVVVLGHERCGAVDATLKGGTAPGHIGSLVAAIRPAVVATKGRPGDALDNAVRANVLQVVEQLKGSRPILAELVEHGRLTIVGGRYDLETGQVEILR